MNVFVKDFYVSMELKSNGIELGVYTPDNETQLGDCYVAMKGLTWCKGKTTRDNGILVKWQDLIDICRSDETLKTALKAAKAVP